MRPKNAVTLVSYNRFKAAFNAHSTARNRVRQEAFLGASYDSNASLLREKL